MSRASVWGLPLAAPLVLGTRARVLAMYVVYEDPMPMLVDYPGAYRGQPGLRVKLAPAGGWAERITADR